MVYLAVECQTLNREVLGLNSPVVSLSKAHLLPKLLVNTQAVVARSRHNGRIVDSDVKAEYGQTNNFVLCTAGSILIGSDINFYCFPKYINYL